MPLVIVPRRDTGFRSITCACGATFDREEFGTFYAHMGMECPITRCANCLMALQSDHPFPGTYGDTVTDHLCHQSSSLPESINRG